MKYTQKKQILINGFFLCRTLTGVERYAYQITKRLDALTKKDFISIIVPKNAKNIPEYKNIKVIRYGRLVKNILYQMFFVQFFLIRHRQYIIFDFGNTALPLAPGIICLHDIYCALFPEDFTAPRDKLARLYNIWQYKLITKKAKRIITVSEYSKKQIEDVFKAEWQKINVVYSSWEHFKTIEPDYSVFSDFPVLLKKDFYFLLGSISKRKNIKWILEYAAKHPETIFVVSGDNLPTTSDILVKNRKTNYNNIIMTGYINDSKVCALFKKCKAFILPSYYEGFGLTPLEALSCGAKVIVSNTASLPEIYGDTAYYIDPYNTNINLDTLLLNDVKAPGSVLEKYSYDKSAEQVYAIMQDVCGKEEK